MNPSDLARYVGAAPTWLAQGSAFGAVLNPATNALIVDTGGLSAGFYDFWIILTPEAAINLSYFIVAHRNAANTANLHYFYPEGPAGWTFQYKIKGWKVEAGERVRIVTVNTWAGQIYAHIWWVRRA